MSNPKKKIFVAVMNIPSPYRLHLLGEMWRQLHDRGIDFHVHFMRWGYKHLPPSWSNPKIEFPHTIWRDYGIKIYNFNPGLVLKMIFSPPDYMICGSSFDTFTGILIHLFGRAKVKMAWVEGNTKTPGELGGIKGWLKRLVFSHCKFAPVPGSDAAKYIELHQQRTKRKMPLPVYLPNLVDETRFKPREEWPRDQIMELLRRLGVADGERLIITPARLLKVKGLIPYLNLVTPEMMSGWKQMIIGNGILKDEIKDLIHKRGLDGKVFIIETVPYSEMPKYYAAADLMLLPSVYDPNPLASVEALHTGLPIALSDQAGNVEEAVTEGANGWRLPVLDKEAFAAKLKDVFSADKARLTAMGRVSHDVNARFWDTKASISRFLDSVVS